MDAAPHVFRSLLCLTLAPCLLHCGGARQQVVQLDPIEFKVDRSGGGHHVYVRDFATLTDEAMARYHAGEWAEAVRLFDLLVREYPAEPGIAAVQHNAGLALLRLGRPADAAQRGLTGGEVVRVFNDRGSCLAGVVLDARKAGHLVVVVDGKPWRGQR